MISNLINSVKSPGVKYKLYNLTGGNSKYVVFKERDRLVLINAIYFDVCESLFIKLAEPDDWNMLELLIGVKDNELRHLMILMISIRAIDLGYSGALVRNGEDKFCALDFRKLNVKDLRLELKKLT